MVGPKPKPVRPKSAKTVFEKPSEGKLSKKSKKPVVKAVEAKVAVSKKSAKTAPAVKDAPVKKDEVKRIEKKEVVEIKLEQIVEGVKAFKKLLELNSGDDANKDLFASEGKKINLQISGIKIPRESERQVIKVKLPYVPLPENRDICLFVKDLEKGLKVDHEDTVRHFTDLLEEKGVKGITQVISLRELKVEYKQFEAKLQLCNKFDLFLADARIIRLLPQFLGKHFYKRKKLPLQIDLNSRDLAAEFQRCVSTTQLAMTHTGATSMVNIGTSNHSSSQLIDNIKAVTDSLVTKYPGGWQNIRSIFLNCGSNSLPLYASIRSTNDVGFVSGKKTKSKGLVTGELSTVVGAEVTVTPFGNVRVKRKADPNWTEDDETLEKLPKDSEKADEAEDEEENNKNESEVKEDVKEKKAKKKKEVKKSDDDDSEDEMEDQELEYMKKVAEEEEEMERKIEENEDKLGKNFQKDKKDVENSEDEDEEEDESDDEDAEDVDDAAEAINLLSENDGSDSDEDDIMMRKSLKEIDEEIAADPPQKESKKKTEKKMKAKTEKKSLKELNKQAKPLKSKDKKQKKFIEKKKKEKVKSKGKK